MKLSIVAASILSFSVIAWAGHPFVSVGQPPEDLEEDRQSCSHDAGSGKVSCLPGKRGASAVADAVTCAVVSTNWRFDCSPGAVNITEEECEARGCCWSPDDAADVPSCFYPPDYPGYQLVESEETSWGTRIFLHREEGLEAFPNIAQDVVADIILMDRNILRIQVYERNSSRFRPYIPEVPSTATRERRDLRYYVRVNSNPASFQVIRWDTGTVLFDSGFGSMIIAKQFLQISALIPSDDIYGLGEHRDHLRKGGRRQTYTFFNRGDPPLENPGANLYGSFPFYLAMEEDGSSHGVYLLNSHAIDIEVQPTPALTYRAVGGILDFFFFMGPTPDDVVSDFTYVVGRPFLPPYFALGFHLCRYRYTYIEKLKLVWERTVNAGIPFDVQWNDIDNFDDYKTWTYSEERFKGLPEFIDNLHDHDMYFIMNFSPGLSSTESPGSYLSYDEAAELDIFVKLDGKPIQGKTWNNITQYIDFTHPNTQKYWTKQFKDFHKIIRFDAAWIDMNEPYTFITGSLNGCPEDRDLESPPYVPGGDPLYTHTLCMSSKHHIGYHYDVHNLYAFGEAIATFNAMADVLNIRPFVLSRSTFPGIGKYSGHWNGDIFSTWEDMRHTIPNMLEFNMYGIPMIGADICGFFLNTTNELCIRWTQLGAFYPFSRNHNDENSKDQDPVALGEDVVAVYRDVYRTRYYLLPYLYTLFFESHLLGKPVARPLFFEFPLDKDTYHLETQFLWGRGLMVIPVLEQGATTVEAYLPEHVWYDFYDGERLPVGRVTLSAPLEKINLAVMGGAILPAQEPGTNTKSSRRNSFHLIAALDEDGSATGTLTWDDGMSIDTVQSQAFNLIRFYASENRLTTVCMRDGYDTRMDLTVVKVYGVTLETVKTVEANGIQQEFTFKNSTKVLTVNLKDTCLRHSKNLIYWSD